MVQKLWIMRIKNTSFFYILLILAALWHLWSLQYSPIPWFDETFFVSITNALLKGKGFLLEVCPIQTGGQEVLAYGPVYFLLTGLSFKLGGFGLFQFRIVSLIFAGLSIFVFSKILTNYKIPTQQSRWLVLLIVFDVIVNRNSHSGRMDMVALFFALGAWWSMSHPKPTCFKTVLMALCGVTAVLTTPRIAIIVVPLFIYALILFFREKRWLASAIITVLPIFIYMIWVIYAFQDISNFLQYYIAPKQLNADSSIVSKFLGGNFFIPYHQWPLILTGLLAAGRLMAPKNQRLQHLLFLLPLALFYSLVRDTGAYSALIVPFWYLIIGLALTSAMKENQKVAKILSYGLIAIAITNISIFAFTSAAIIGRLPQRDPRSIQAWVKRHIPENAKIVGDDRYYYACMENNCDYQYINRVGDHDVRAKYHATSYRPDYLFISQLTPKEIIGAYRAQFNFLDSLNYTPPPLNPVINKVIQALPLNIQADYKGTLITVKPKQSINQ